MMEKTKKKEKNYTRFDSVTQISHNMRESDKYAILFCTRDYANNKGTLVINILNPASTHAKLDAQRMHRLHFHVH